MCATGLADKMQYSGNKQVLREAWQASTDGECAAATQLQQQLQEHVQVLCTQLQRPR
jgi:hypothetical protein